MSTRTYTFTLKSNHFTPANVNIKAKKDHAEHIAYKLRDLLRLEQHERQLSGVIGVDERASEVMIVFGKSSSPIRDYDAYQTNVAIFLTNLPDPITPENWKETVYPQWKALKEAHIPIVDERRTPDEQQAHDQKVAEVSQQYAALQEAKSQAFLDEFSNGLAPLPLPAGCLAVVLQVTYNNSDVMTDYFDHHHHYQFPLLLGFVRKQNETERLARQLVAQYPELAGMEWTWDTQKWRGGNGNFLESGPVGHLDETVKVYRGETAPAYWFEIRFSTYDKAFYQFRGYGEQADDEPETPAAETDGDLMSATIDGVSYSLTYERDWTWLTTSRKPDDAALNVIRAAKDRIGGGWGKQRRQWFFKTHVTLADIGLVA